MGCSQMFCHTYFVLPVPLSYMGGPGENIYPWLARTALPLLSPVPSGAMHCQGAGKPLLQSLASAGGSLWYDLHARQNRV